MDKTYLQEAFHAMEILNEEDFRLDDVGVRDLLDFKDFDELNDIVDVVDPEAEVSAELNDTYIGKVILECEVCHSPIFMDIEDVKENNDGDLVNIDFECPICHSMDGFKVIGQVAPYKEDNEIKVEIEDKVDDSEVASEVEEKIDELEDKVAELEDKVEEISNEGEESADEESEEDEEEKEEVEESLNEACGDKKLDEEDDEEEVVIEDEIEADDDISDIVDADVEEEKSLEDKVEEIEEKVEELTDTVVELEAVVAEAEAPIEDAEEEVIEDEEVEEVEESLNESEADEDDATNGVEKVDANNLTGVYSDEEQLAKDVKRYLKALKDFVRYDSHATDKEKALADYKEKMMQCKSATELKRCYRGILDGILGESLDEAAETKYQQEITDTKTGDTVTISGDSQMDLNTNVRKFEQQHGGQQRYENGASQRQMGNTISDRKEATPEAKIEEGFEKVDLEMEDKIIHVSEEEKPEVPGEEMIVPVSDEVEAEITAPEEDAEIAEEPVEIEEPIEDEIDVEADDIADEDEDVDYELDDFEEDDFDDLGESYLKKVYENVESFKTSKVTAQENTLVIEGIIKFNSGKEKATQFIFEASDATKDGKVRFIGENAQISRGKKSFTLSGKIEGSKFIAESLNYNYRAKDAEGNSTRLYGTVKRN